MKKRIYEAYEKLTYNSNIFECYVKSTPLATLYDYIENVEEDETLISEKSINIFNKIKEKIEKSKVTIIDLDPTIVLDISVIINNRLNIKPILSFNHIYHPYGIVGNLEITQTIILRAIQLENIEPKGYCFLLDYHRYFNDKKNILYTDFDNQYEITDEELPYDYILKEIGCSKVLVITKKEIKEDLTSYINYLIKNNIEVDKVLI